MKFVMQQLLLFFFISLLTSISALAEKQSKSPYSGTLTDMQEVLAFGFASDIQKFCNRSNYEGLANNFLEQNNLHPLLRESERVKQNITSHLLSRGTAWYLSWLPTEKTRNGVLDFALKDVGLHQADSEERFQKLLAAPPQELSPTQYTENKEKFLMFKKHVFLDPNLSQPYERRFAACATVTSVLSAPSCAQWLDKLTTIASPSNDVMLLDVYEDVLFSEKYTLGLHRAAGIIYKKYSSGKTPSGDFFSDLKQSFLETGSSEEEAKEQAWQTIALVATGGPNLGRRLGVALDQNQHPSSVFLAAIAGMLPMLDLNSKGEQRLYSYPENTLTQCDVGKPYHFWMSAYLTRRLIKEGADPESGATAVFVAQMGYQFLGSTGLRNPHFVYERPSFEGFNNIMRVDFVQTAAGAKHAVNQEIQNSEPIDINQGIANIVADSEIIGTMSTEESQALFSDRKLKAFSLFSRKLSPRSAFRTYFDSSYQPRYSLLPPDQ